MTILLCVLMALAPAACTAGTGSVASVAQVIDTGDRNDKIIHKTLMEQYQRWHKTPYVRGGLSLKGVDCSGLVYRIFRDNFNVRLPRTVAGQIRTGRQVPRDELKPGDLVFFKTGRRSRHVGIYIGNHRFLHTSQRAGGVIISTLKNPYWHSAFHKAGSVLF